MPPQTSSKKRSDRRLLGDKWLDWDGRQDKDLASADTAITVSLVLAGVLALSLVGFLFLLWYLVTPRLQQFHALAPWFFGAMVVGASLFILAIGASLILTLATGRNLLIVTHPNKILLGAVSLLQRLGKRFGLSSDRVSNSLLKLNNALILGTTRFTGDERVLLLLPRCLTKEIRKEIVHFAETVGLPHATCAGGEDARKQILLAKPHVVLAVACERDLIAGMCDVKGRIPVIGLPNSRPKGPCTCTEIDTNSFVEILVKLKKKHANGAQSEPTPPN